MAGVVHVPFYATLFRGDKLEAAVAELAPISLRYGATAYAVHRNRDDAYKIHPAKVADEISRGTSVILTSNPRNPTGQVITNPELAEIQDICRDRATLIMDEFYGVCSCLSPVLPVPPSENCKA